MRKVEIARVTPEHVAQMMPHVRQADREEFIAAANMEPQAVIAKALRTSTIAAAGLINGQVVTIFGAAPASLITGRGVPWLVSTDLMEEQPLTFLRHCRPVLRIMARQYPVLENFVDARNHAAKAWLHWMGFKLDEPKPYGYQGLPFHHFEMRTNHV